MATAARLRAARPRRSDGSESSRSSAGGPVVALGAAARTGRVESATSGPSAARQGARRSSSGSGAPAWRGQQRRHGEGRAGQGVGEEREPASERGGPREAQGALPGVAGGDRAPRPVGPVGGRDARGVAEQAVEERSERGRGAQSGKQDGPALRERDGPGQARRALRRLPIHDPPCRPCERADLVGRALRALGDGVLRLAPRQAMQHLVRDGGGEGRGRQGLAPTLRPGARVVRPRPAQGDALGPQALQHAGAEVLEPHRPVRRDVGGEAAGVQAEQAPGGRRGEALGRVPDQSTEGQVREVAVGLDRGDRVAVAREPRQGGRGRAGIGDRAEQRRAQRVLLFGRPAGEGPDHVLAGGSEVEQQVGVREERVAQVVGQGAGGGVPVGGEDGPQEPAQHRRLEALGGEEAARVEQARDGIARLPPAVAHERLLPPQGSLGHLRRLIR